ncbi:AMP-binding protein [Baekduia soli]|uniref:AMP-binding protein n=1 Tax=Baekduia soli TaxID=496014 RepID=A0A5B8U9R0_9ACTN|nr:AMP-binding protein [Baekduia soli]QEC49737.1 AMP-binding protein [Baekduia soli]
MIDVVGDRTLNDLLDERVALGPDHQLLVFEDAEGAVSELTYGGFQDLVLRAARGLQELGVGHGDRVAVQLRNSPEILVIWFALARLGAIFAPSNVANTTPELEHILRKARVSLLIVEPDYRAIAEGAIAAAGGDVTLVIARGPGGDAVTFSDLLEREPLTDAPDVGAMDVCELIFTSGTTSKPKAVMLTHAHCVRSGEDAVRCIGLHDGDRCMTSLPLFHCNAQAMTALAAMTVYGTIILLEVFSATKYWSQLRRHGATETALVAMQLRTLNAQPVDPDERDHRLHRVFYSLNVPDEERLSFEDRFGVTLINGYGQSEAMVMITSAPLVGDRRWPSIGLPIAGRNVHILDEEGNPVPRGEVGEICVEGTPGRDVFLGYFDDPDATAQTFRDGLLHTGDNAMVDDKGFFYFFDRKKDMIKRAGENVSAMEVESALIAHPEVATAAVIGVPDPIRDEEVVAVVVAEHAGAVTAEELREHCAQRLARFKVPTTIQFVDELPLTSVGKVRKDALRKEWTDAAQARATTS